MNDCDADEYRTALDHGRHLERERLAALFLDFRHLLRDVRPGVCDPVLRARIDAALARIGGKA